MSRRYNSKRYKVFSKANGKIRKVCCPNSMVALKQFGFIFGILGSFLNKLIHKPIATLAYFVNGRYFYNKRKQSPYKGSVLYTLIYWGLHALVAIIVFGIVALAIWLMTKYI